MSAEDNASDADADNNAGKWKMLVVDDDDSVLQVTRLSLLGFEYCGRAVELLYASSGIEARNVYLDNDDIALILLDVVMESEHAGLEFADFVRKEQNNPYVRIVLRTGQAGRLSVPDVVRDYDVNDFCEKTDLTADRMFVVLHTALRDRDFLLEQERMRAKLTETVSELEASNTKLEIFASMAGHDLQAPLRKISWRVSRAGEALTNGEASDVVADEVKAIERNCQYLAGLLRSLLNYSQLRRSALQMEEVSLNTVLQNVISNLESDIRECQGAVTLPSDVGKVRGELNLLTTLFQNLVSNGLKFTRPKMLPVVRLTASQQPLAADGSPGICIEVRDEGLGIAARDLVEVFEPFRRSTATENYAGSGLGLSIAKQIVDEHGGEISLQSEVGKGTTVRVILPAA